MLQSHFVGCKELLARGQVSEAIVSLMQDLNALNIQTIQFNELLIRLIQQGYVLTGPVDLDWIMSNWGPDTYLLDSVQALLEHLYEAESLGIIIEDLPNGEIELSLSEDFALSQWVDFEIPKSFFTAANLQSNTNHGASIQ